MINEIILHNTVSKVSYTMNSTTADYLIEDGSINWGNVESNHHTYSYPEQIGEFLNVTTVGTRTVTIFGWIVGVTHEEVKYKKSLLSRHINPQQPLEIQVEGFRLLGSPDSQVKYSSTYNENNETMCKFLVSIFCPNPLFVAIDPSTAMATETKPMFSFPIHMTETSPTIFGVKKPSLFTDIVNTGSISVGATITFIANGVVHNPKLFKVLSGEYIKINATLNAGDTVTVVTENGKRNVRTFIGGVEQNNLMYLDLDSTWLQFDIGTTVVGFSTDVGGTPDETYKNVTISVAIYPSTYNLEEE